MVEKWGENRGVNYVCWKNGEKTGENDPKLEECSSMMGMLFFDADIQLRFSMVGFLFFSDVSCRILSVLIRGE